MHTRILAARVLAINALQECIRDRCSNLAAAIAFYAVIALPPFLGGVVAVAGAVLGAEWTTEHILPVMREWLGPRGAVVVQSLLQHSRNMSGQQVVSLSIIASVSLIIGGTGFFMSLQNALETVWTVRREIARPTVQIKKRLRVLIVAISTVVILVAGLAVAGLGQQLVPDRGGWRIIAVAGGLMIMYIASAALVTLWMRLLLPVRLALKQILPWSLAIALLHMLGKVAIALYVDRPEVMSDVNLVEAIVLSILWIFYAATALLYVSELMRLYLQKYKDVAMPPPTA